MKIDSLDILLEEELKDLYSAEKQLLKALPKMAKKASSEELRAAFEEHLTVTEDKSPGWRKCSNYSAKLPRPKPAKP